MNDTRHTGSRLCGAASFVVTGDFVADKGDHYGIVYELPHYADVPPVVAKAG